MNDTTPIVNRVVDALPPQDHATQLLWVRLHKLSEKVDILIKLHARQQEEIRVLAIETLQAKIRAERKPSWYFVLSIMSCLLVTACATTALICLTAPANHSVPQESK